MSKAGKKMTFYELPSMQVWCSFAYYDMCIFFLHTLSWSQQSSHVHLPKKDGYEAMMRFKRFLDTSKPVLFISTHKEVYLIYRQTD